MKAITILCVLCALLILEPASGQSSDSLTTALAQRYEMAKLNLTEAADAMPAEDYDYRLSPKQRMYGEWFAHTAVMNLRLCSALRGDPAPAAKELPGTTPKAGIQAELKRSFDYCDEAYKKMNDAVALKETEVEARKFVPAVLMIDHVTALNEHFGNLVGYLRTKGITPPTTARRERMQKK